MVLVVIIRVIIHVIIIVVTFCDIIHNIARRRCCCCRGWITKDELGMVGVSESWIESNQLCYIDGSMTDNV